MTDRLVTAKTVRDLLRKRHEGADWFLAFEVANSTGYMGVSRADAVAMNIWPSRGYAIHGYEIKVSRSDWLRELRQPKKADSVAEQCDYWWVIAPNDVIEVSEIPHTWGAMIATPKRLRKLKDAPPRELHPRMARGFVASLIRRSNEEDPAFKETLNNAVAAAVKEHESSFERRNQQMTQDLDRARRFQAGIQRVLGDRSYGVLSAEGEQYAHRLQAAERLANLFDGYGGLNVIENTAKRLLESVEELREVDGDIRQTRRATHD